MLMTHFSMPAMNPENFRSSSPLAANRSLSIMTRSATLLAPPPTEVAPPPCLTSASTSLHTLVGIRPNEVMTSGLSPSSIIACKAGHSSWKRMHLTEAADAAAAAADSAAAADVGVDAAASEAPPSW